MTCLNPLPLCKRASKCLTWRWYPSCPMYSFAYVNASSRWFSGSPTHIQGAALDGITKVKMKISDAGVMKVKDALLEYLHLTRGLRFSDAENMSYNAPNFISQLLEKIEVEEEDVGRSVTRFLRFHPINEFEPFFESIGVQPSEISQFTPRYLMFLSDDKSLLDNYYALCDFGIPRKNVGKIYENCREFLYCGTDVLLSKVQASADLGFTGRFLPMLLARTPQIFSAKVLGDAAEVVSMLKKADIDIVWVENHLEISKIYKWSTMRAVLRLFNMSGYTNEQLRLLIKEHPGVLFHKSGYTTLSIISFLSKLGLNLSDICAVFLQFTKVHVEAFYSNLRRSFVIFNWIEMEMDTIVELFTSHSALLGCCKIKTGRSLLKLLNVGKTRLRKCILQDPQILKKWVVGRKLESLPSLGMREKSKLMRGKFLRDIGYTENSPEMKVALKMFRGCGSDLQERFDSLVKSGFSPEEVLSMVTVSPQILNMRSDSIQKKLKIFVEDLKYPLSDLLKCPYYLCYTPERVKLRASMYDFVRKSAKIEGGASFRTIIACTDSEFFRRYVQPIPGGCEFWEQLKKTMNTD